MISDPYILGILRYVGAMLVGALAAGLSVLMVQLAGTDPIVWRPVIAAALGPIVTGLIARQLTRGGREEIGNLVTSVGVPQAKAALEVEATRQTVGLATVSTDVLAAIPTMSAADLVAVRDAAMARHEALTASQGAPSTPDQIIGLIDQSEHGKD